jgi:hypothetical protein
MLGVSPVAGAVLAAKYWPNDGVTLRARRSRPRRCEIRTVVEASVQSVANLVPQHFSIAHYRSEGTAEVSRFVGTKVEFGADTDEIALNSNARELPVIHVDPYLNNLLLKYCEAAPSHRAPQTPQRAGSAQSLFRIGDHLWRQSHTPKNRRESPPCAVGIEAKSCSEFRG